MVAASETVHVPHQGDASSDLILVQRHDPELSTRLYLQPVQRPV